MSRHLHKLTSVVVLAMALGLSNFEVATADDKPLSVKRGKIDIPEDRRSFAKEFSAIAKKYPTVVKQTRVFEDMCEANPSCFYVQTWTACCCQTAGDTVCEAWPPL